MGADRLRVIVNDRCLRKARTGVGHYVAELLAELPRVDAALEILPFYQTFLARNRLSGGTRSSEAGSAHAKQPSEPGSPQTNRSSDWARRILQGCYEFGFEAIGGMLGYSLYHEPNHIPGPWQGPIVTTIHDLSVLLHPEWHPVDRVRWYERDFMGSLPRCEHFIAVSDFTRQEMIEHLHLEPARITTIHLGVRSVFGPRDRVVCREWLAGRDLPEEYLLFVGTLEPRKNLAGLLAAYVQLPVQLRRRAPLLLAGTGGWGDERLESLIERHGLRDSVRLLGYVTDADLAWLYAGARAFVWPSKYEGFGLPILESMACGTPVITSQASSLPEVAGEAAMLIHPDDSDQLALAMRRVLEDADLRNEMSQAGLERSSAFSWKACAARHAQLFRRYWRP